MKIKLGVAITGSFCTFDKILIHLQELSATYDIVPILSFNAATIDTRFGRANDFIEKIIAVTGKKPIDSIQSAEPIGPKNMTDIMLVAPCTGNTLAKLAVSITDTPVTMAVKSHLRNKKPVVISLSTNDALSGTAKNLASLLNTRNYYFVPFYQDDYNNKPFSLTADLSLIKQTLNNALEGKQLQPIISKGAQ